MKPKGKTIEIHALLGVAFQERRKEIEMCLERLLREANALPKPSQKKKTPPVSFRVKLDGLEGDQKKLLRLVRGEFRDTALIAQFSALVSGIPHMNEASRALKKGEFDLALAALHGMSQAVGAANAFAAYAQFDAARAKFKAHIRHDANKQIKEEILDLWRRHVDPKLSPPAAARVIGKYEAAQWADGKRIPENKLAEWIREAKKPVAH